MNIKGYNFSREEMACKCGCGFDTADVELLEVMEVVREFIGPFVPNSVCRCLEHNRDVGSSDKSQHVLAKACDVPTTNSEELYEFLDTIYPDTYGIGLYNNFVHIDVREKKARW